jgi:peroxiredoxin
MSEKSSGKSLKAIGFVVLVFVVGVGGVLVGHVLRDRLGDSQKTELTMPAPKSLLKSGMMFPDVTVVSENGATMHTGEMIGGEGCVVLFLDLDCPPCQDMTDKWQRAADRGDISYHQLWGITFHPRDVVDEYAATHGVGFPIIVDTSLTFFREYEVNRFPLEVVVGASGNIRATSYNAAAPVDAKELAGMLAR